MRYLRCQCGKAEMWTTDAPRPCQGCDECGTTFAGSPDGHKQREPHQWKPQFNQNTGKPDRPYCAVCYEKGDKP